MKINNKGFTMVEILAAVSILAILSGVAVSAVTKYQEKARQKAYQSMEQSTYSAAYNYILDTGRVVPNTYITIQVTDLVNDGYLQRLEDPRAKGADCHANSKVEVKKLPKPTFPGLTPEEEAEKQKTILDQYEFKVTIKCKNYTSGGGAGVIFKS